MRNPLLPAFSDPLVIADKLAIAQDAGAKGRTAEDAARLVGWTVPRYTFTVKPTPPARAPQCWCS